MSGKTTNAQGPSCLSDDALIEALELLMTRGRRVDADILRHIGEVQERRLYRQHACSSVYTFCVERLGMSEGAAYKRIRVARAARKFPEILEYLEQGKVHLAGLHVLAPHLTISNAKGVLERAAGKSKRQIESLARELDPKVSVATSIRPLPRSSQLGTEQELSPGTVGGTSLAESFRAAPTTARVEALAPTRFRVHFTASERLKRNLDKARELAGFGASVEGLFEQAIELLVEKLERDRLGVPGRKARAVRSAGRYIAKAVRREVFERDEGQCTFRDKKGRRCSERRGLQFDHVVPFAKGGVSSAENLRLRCGPHNQLHAEESYGPLFVASKREGSSARAP